MKFSRFLGRLALVACSFLIPVAMGPVQAQQAPGLTGQVKPVVVTSLAGVDRLLDDIDYLGRISGRENLAETVKTLLATQTGEASVPGVDSKRPCGLVIQTNGFELLVSGFVPVSDFDKLRKFLESRDIELTQKGNIWSTELPNGQSLYVTHKNNWAILSMNEQHLAQVGGDPPGDLTELSTQYDLGILLHVANIPPMFRQLGLSLIQQGMEVALQRQAEATGEDVSTQRQALENSFHNIQTMLEETETITIGLTVNDPAAAVSLSARVKTRPGTQSARDLRENQNLKTRVTGFILPESTILIRGTARASQREIEQFKASFPAQRKVILENIDRERGMSTKEKRLLKNFLSALLDAISATVEKGTIDVAFSARLSDRQFELLGGMPLSDAAKLEEETLRLFQQLPESESHLQINAAKYKGFRFHVVSVTPNDLEKAPANLRDMLGGSFSVIIAFSDDALAIAAGPQAEAMLKAAIDKMDQEVPVSKVSEGYIALSPLVKLIGAMADEAEVRERTKEWIPLLGNKDRVAIEEVVTEDAVSTRIDIQEGVIKWLLSLVEEARQKALDAAGLPVPAPIE